MHRSQCFTRFAAWHFAKRLLCLINSLLRSLRRFALRFLRNSFLFFANASPPLPKRCHPSLVFMAHCLFSFTVAAPRPNAAFLSQSSPRSFFRGAASHSPMADALRRRRRCDRRPFAAPKNPRAFARAANRRRPLARRPPPNAASNETTPRFFAVFCGDACGGGDGASNAHSVK